MGNSIKNRKDKIKMKPTNYLQSIIMILLVCQVTATWNMSLPEQQNRDLVANRDLPKEINEIKNMGEMKIPVVLSEKRKEKLMNFKKREEMKDVLVKKFIENEQRKEEKVMEEIKEEESGEELELM